MRTVRAVIFIVLGLTVALPVYAKDNCPVGISQLRFEDDWKCYQYRLEPEGIDQLKAIPIDSGSWLSIGGEIRQRFEHTSNADFGSSTQKDSGVWLQRYTLHGDLQLGDNIRLFGQLSSALQSGRTGGPSPVDKNELAVQNMFAEFTAPVGNLVAGLRAGRQELSFGSGRLIDVREGPNVRRTFDALRAHATVGDLRVDGFVSRPISPRFGVFDDKMNKSVTAWGLYATQTGYLPFGGALDLYYIGYDDRDATFAQDTGEETRHSLGARFFGDRGDWDWNWEAVYQFGSFNTEGGRKDIRAWTLASETAYTFRDTSWQPRLALSANIASGDKNPADRNLGTFNPLFPRGNYFSEAAVLGPRNFYNLHGFISVQPVEKLSLIADYNLFWRLKKGDGVYGPTGQLLAPAGGDERFVGSALSVTAEYSYSERLLFTLITTRFFPDALLTTSPTRTDLQFIEITAQYRF